MNDFDERAIRGKSLFTRREKKLLFEKCMTILGLHDSPPSLSEAEANIELKERMTQTADITVPAQALLSLPEGIVFTDAEGNITAYNQEAQRLLDAEGFSLKGKNAREFCAIIEYGEKIIQELENVEKDSGRGFVENVGVLIKNCHGQQIPVKASFYFYYDAENGRQGAVVQLLKDIGLQRQHLDRIMYEGCEILGIEDSILWLADNLGQSLHDGEAHVELSRGQIIPAYLNEKLKLHHKIADRLLEKQCPLFITDIGDKKWRRLYTHYDWAKRHNWKSLLSVPIILNDTIVGIWNLHSKEARHFDEAELGLADLLGKHIATELFKADPSNQNSIYGQIRSLYSQLKRTREQLVDAYKQARISEKRIAEAWHHGKESAKAISSPFEWVNGTVFTDEIKPFKETKKFLENALTDLRKKMGAETVSLFLTDSAKPFMFKKIVEVDMNITTSEVDCRFRKSNPKDKTGLKKDEIYHLFNSVCGRKLLDIDPGLFIKLNKKIECIKLTGEVQALLKNEAFQTLGDLAIMREEDFAKSFCILPETLEYIKGLLQRYGLTFGMGFFVKDRHKVVRIEKDIQQCGLFPERNLKRMAEITSSHRIAHYVSVPICYRDSTMSSRQKMVGFVRALNKTYRKIDGFRSRYELGSGFTEDDVDSMKITADKLGEFIADFYRADVPEKQKNGSSASAFNKYNERLLKMIEDGQPHAELWEALEQESTYETASWRETFMRYIDEKYKQYQAGGNIKQ